MDYKNRNKRRNAPIATLIRNYIDKRSGKVSESRREIQWRFRALDWKDQKKILSAFLEAGKVDRHWAYKEILDYWDGCFEAKIKELWEQYHEQRCKWVVIRYLPLDYIRQNLHEFTEERDYYFACLRLAKDKDFVIEREKLSYTDYLAVLYHTGRAVDENEGLDILYQIVHNYCVKGIDEYEVSTSRDKSMGLACPIHLRDVRLAFYYLERADCSKPVLDFEEWNDKVNDAMNNCIEYKKLFAHGYSGYDYNRRELDILRKYAYLALDEKYKKPSDPSIDDILKPVEAYARGDKNVSDFFLITPHDDSILAQFPQNDIPPF